MDRYFLIPVTFMVLYVPGGDRRISSIKSST